MTDCRMDGEDRIVTFAHGTGARVMWVADLLPDAAAGPIGAMMEQGVAAMRKTLGR